MRHKTGDPCGGSGDRDEGVEGDVGCGRRLLRTVLTFGLSRVITDRKLAELALREQSERLSAVIATQRDIAAADLDLQSVMGLICARTQALTGADSASILLMKGDSFVNSAATGFLDSTIGVSLPVAGSLTGWVYEHNTPVLCNDTRADPRVHPSGIRNGIASMVVVPLQHGEETVGILMVASQEPGSFADDSLGTLELLSVVLSSALSHAAEFEAKRAEADARARLETIYEQAPIGIGILDLQGRLVNVNPAMREITDYSAEELARKDVSEYVHPEDREQTVANFVGLVKGERASYRQEMRLFRADGEIVWVDSSVALVRDADGQPSFAVAMAQDVTQRKAAEEALLRQAELTEYQALHDGLTGLANRRLFRDRVEQAVLAAQREGGRVAVLMIDVDRFKEINDSLGHHSGDDLLKELADRLRRPLRVSDTVARLGGDEFGVLLARPHDANDVALVIERIRKALEPPVVLQELPIAIEGSIGVSLFPEHGGDVDTLLRHADLAMYASKESNAGFTFYDAASHGYDPSRPALLGELRRAIEERELVLFYQPKVLLASGQIGSVEALLRWRHPDRGLILPDDFIPLAQETSLIKPLTLYVVDEALRQRRAWQTEGLELAVAVNLFVRNLLDAELPEQLRRLLEKWDVEPAALELEITESTMLADPLRTKLLLDRLSAMGIRLSIDDFGAGYSSLAYLKRLPVDEIKIDRSFVVNMDADEDDAAIVRSTIDLARNLGLDVVAEGVETAETWGALSSLGCTAGQGFYLSPPVTADELRDWLRARRAATSVAAA